MDIASNKTDMGPLLTNIRTRATLLVDRLDWKDFDLWVTWEYQRGLALMQEAMFTGHRSGSMTVGQVLKINEPCHTWCAAFNLNLRHFRSLGEAPPKEVAGLISEAQKDIAAVNARNGWPMPQQGIAGLSPLIP